MVRLWPLGLVSARLFGVLWALVVGAALAASTTLRAAAPAVAAPVDPTSTPLGSGPSDPSGSPPVLAAAPVLTLPSAEAIATLSDRELTSLSTHWQSLDAVQRRALLRTVTARMAAKQQRASKRIPLQVQRRYGHVVRRNGGTLSIETRIVRRAAPVADADQPSSTEPTLAGPPTAPPSADPAQPRAPQRASGALTFGVGFEQRRHGPSRDANPKAGFERPSQTVSDGVLGFDPRR
ncbi:MAG: hypothetical protein AAF648_06375 [Pseudomonadota bacterium]